MPYALQNVLLGFLNIPFLVYISSSALGLIPESVHPLPTPLTPQVLNAWLGFTLRNAADLLVSFRPSEPADIASLCLQIFGAVAITLVLLWYYRRYIKRLRHNIADAEKANDAELGEKGVGAVQSDL